MLPFFVIGVTHKRHAAAGDTFGGCRWVVRSGGEPALAVEARPTTLYNSTTAEPGRCTSRGLIPMDPRRLSERTRESLAALSPEKRARAEAALTRIQSPEYQESERRDRDALDREYRTTGTITSTPVTEADVEAFDRFIRSLRQVRESAGLSLDEVATRSGIDKAQLSRLENGKVHDPRSSTLLRYARAIGKRLAWSLEDSQSR